MSFLAWLWQALFSLITNFSLPNVIILSNKCDTLTIPTIPQLVSTELEDSTIIYFQLEEPTINPSETTRSFEIGD